MKVQIRHSFETNSSSSHSLVLQQAREDEWSNAANWLKAMSVTDVTSADLGFGWEFTKYKSYPEKLAYLFLDGKREVVIAAMKRVIENGGLSVDSEDDQKLLHLSEEISRMSSSFDAYIDHQSVGTTYELFVGPQEVAADLVAEFFVSRSYIQGGNDNEDDYESDYDYTSEDDLD